ncbi:hypothetical protein JMT66_23340 (plasmid) [Kosakonia cowanii]|uniref:hypothetical protein n=1 Tax=Kosakonia cowanii TaxID=208223 RepID=UPI001E3C9607|nr:hypothetical protein [Kosakonia cowanii]UGS48614.1 hypothetical protein JMT66_23340 [Kosakonia cowanii]
MNDDYNITILRKTGSDIQKWERNAFTPRQVSFYVVLFVIVMVVAAGNEHIPVLLGMVIGAATGVMFLIPGWRNDNWPRAIRRRLSHYRPRNKAAWQHFQETIERKWRMDPVDLRTWYESECMTVFHPEKATTQNQANTPDKATVKT